MPLEKMMLQYSLHLQKVSLRFFDASASTSSSPRQWQGSSSSANTALGSSHTGQEMEEPKVPSEPHGSSKVSSPLEWNG